VAGGRRAAAAWIVSHTCRHEAHHLRCTADSISMGGRRFQSHECVQCKFNSRLALVALPEVDMFIYLITVSLSGGSFKIESASILRPFADHQRT
jgi:hypothetical protein